MRNALLPSCGEVSNSGGSGDSGVRVRGDRGGGGEWEWERGLLWGVICYGVGE